MCVDKTFKPGMLRYFYPTPYHDAGSILIAFATKMHWSNPSRLEWIKDGLVRLETDLAEGASTAATMSPVAIPRIGCGFGGLYWDDVAPLIHDMAERLDSIDFLVYDGEEYADRI